MAVLTWEDVGLAIGINSAVAVGMFFLFNFIRSNHALVKFYAAKRYLKLPFRYRPKRLPNTLFTWMAPMFKYTDDEIMACAGLDALTYLRFLNLGLKIAVVVTFFAMAMCLPTNLVGDWVGDEIERLRAKRIANGCGEEEAQELSGDPEDILASQTAPGEDEPEPTCPDFTCPPIPDDVCTGFTSCPEIDCPTLSCPENDGCPGFSCPQIKCPDFTCSSLSCPQISCTTSECPATLYTDFDKTSLSNVSDGSHLMWVHVACCFIITYFVMKFLWSAYLEAVNWRIYFLSQTRQGNQSHTILVQDIPGCLNGTLAARIYDNLDGVIGWFLPKSVKKKVREIVELGTNVATGDAATSGATKITGKQGISRDTLSTDMQLPGLCVQLSPSKQNVAPDISDSCCMQLGLTGGTDLFTDENYDVYTNPSAQRHLYESNNGGQLTELSDALEFQDAASFRSARSSISLSSMKSAGSLPRDEKGMTRTTNPHFENIGDTKMMVNNIEPEGAAAGLALLAPPPTPPEKESEHLDEDPNSPKPSVAQRTNLKYFKTRRCPTDFNTWEQAESAVNQGMSVKELVLREFTRTLPHPGDVAAVASVKDQSKLAPLVTKYNEAVLALEEKCDQWTVALRRRKPIKRKMKTVRPLLLGSRAQEKFGKVKSVKVDEMEFLQWQVMSSYNAVKEEQKRAHSLEACAAFVTFSSRVTQSSVANGLQSHNESYWKTSVAPGPEEIIWKSVAYRGWERALRTLLSWGIFIAMCLFFLPPVAFLQQLLNLEQYEEDDSTGIINFLLTAPVISELLKAVLPSLALKIFLALVPTLLRLMNGIQGIYSLSAMDFEVGRKYFIFQFLIVFIFTTISGALLTNVERYADDPSLIAEDLGTTVPQQAGFFILYILTNGLMAKSIAFLRIPGAIIFVILSRLSATERSKRRKWARQYMRYGDDIPDHSLCILLALVFACVQPFVAAVSILYFLVNSFIARYQLLYVFREQFQSGGLFWPVMFEQIFVGLIVFQLSMIGILASKSFPGSAAIIVLLVLSIMFRIAVGKTFSRPMQGLSLHAAADLDRADKKQHWSKDLTPEEEAIMLETFDCEDVRFGPLEERYLSPCFTVSEDDYKQTLHEAEVIVAKVEAREAGHDVSPHDLYPTEEEHDEGEQTQNLPI